MFGKRTEYSSLEEAWVCGSQLVYISGRKDVLGYADISNDAKFEEWIKQGLDTAVFQLS
jgi:hypothetical protein